MQHQRTISQDVLLSGRGLFTGDPVSVRLRPGEPHTGIWFVRTDQSPPMRIAAKVENVIKRARRTVIESGAVAIETVEHFLGALSGLGIDNALIEIDAHELPGVDGSCMPFVESIKEAGLQQQDAFRDPCVISEPVRVVDGDAELVALPLLDGDAELLHIAYELDYGDGNPIGAQSYRVSVTPERFIADIAPARTFVLKSEADQLHSAGLGVHLSYQDILVFGDDGPIDNPLRYTNECVRHKILDLIGDLSLLGRPIVGRVLARKSGHALNHQLVRAIIAQSDAVKSRDGEGRQSVIDVHQIQRILPHRYPFLMVDRIIEIQGLTKVVGVKNVTSNEPFFQGHYPGDPIMPGVLIVEALAQVGGILLSQALEHKGKVAVLLGLDKVKFRRPVRPGDQLILEVEAIRVRPTSGHVKGRALVNGEIAAEAEIKFMLADSGKRYN